MDQFFTWETLATLAGAPVAVGILTQFLKDVFKKLPTQWLSYILSVVILAAATGFTNAWAAPAAVWTIIPLNAVIVSLTSNGAYAAILRAKNRKSE